MACLYGKCIVEDVAQIEVEVCNILFFTRDTPFSFHNSTQMMFCVLKTHTL